MTQERRARALRAVGEILYWVHVLGLADLALALRVATALGSAGESHGGALGELVARKAHEEHAALSAPEGD